MSPRRSQSVLDALADAETLRWFAYSMIGGGGRRDRRIMGRIAPATVPAVAADIFAADGSPVGSLLLVAPQAFDEHAIDFLATCAHAAFRAIPGLRGEP